MFEDAPARFRDGAPTFAEETDLVAVGFDHHGRKARMESTTATAWGRMREEAVRDGEELLLISAFRSVEYQAGIIPPKTRRRPNLGRDLAGECIPRDSASITLAGLSTLRRQIALSWWSVSRTLLHSRGSMQMPAGSASRCPIHEVTTEA